MKSTRHRAWTSATGHGPGVRRHWASLTPAEQGQRNQAPLGCAQAKEREYSPYALYVSLTEYLTIRNGHQ